MTRLLLLSGLALLGCIVVAASRVDTTPVQTSQCIGCGAVITERTRYPCVVCGSINRHVWAFAQDRVAISDRVN